MGLEQVFSKITKEITYEKIGRRNSLKKVEKKSAEESV